MNFLKDLFKPSTGRAIMTDPHRKHRADPHLTRKVIERMLSMTKEQVIDLGWRLNSIFEPTPELEDIWPRPTPGDKDAHDNYFVQWCDVQKYIDAVATKKEQLRYHNVVRLAHMDAAGFEVWWIERSKDDYNPRNEWEMATTPSETLAP